VLEGGQMIRKQKKTAMEIVKLLKEVGGNQTEFKE
jgi:hypothetical protein